MSNESQFARLLNEAKHVKISVHVYGAVIVLLLVFGLGALSF